MIYAKPVYILDVGFEVLIVVIRWAQMLDKLKLVLPDFSSDITDLIIDMNYLRQKPLAGSTPPLLFFQLKDLFSVIESTGSARI